MNEFAKDPFGVSELDCLPAQRINLHERMSALQFEMLSKRLDNLDKAMERLERRLWLIVFGVVCCVPACACCGLHWCDSVCVGLRWLGLMCVGLMLLARAWVGVAVGCGGGGGRAAPSAS